jgi:hypothetical protein
MGALIGASEIQAPLPPREEPLSMLSDQGRFELTLSLLSVLAVAVLCAALPLPRRVRIGLILVGPILGLIAVVSYNESSSCTSECLDQFFWFVVFALASLIWFAAFGLAALLRRLRGRSRQI